MNENDPGGRRGNAKDLRRASALAIGREAGWPRTARGAFSLVETCLAIGIVAFAFAAIFGCIPVGLNAANDATNATKASLIAQDVSDRIHAEVSTNSVPVTPTGHSLRWSTALTTISYGTVAAAASPTTPAASAYYDQSGKFVDQAGTSSNYLQNFYKVTVFVQPLNSYPPNLAFTGTNYPFLTVLIKIGWPAEAKKDGNLLSAGGSSQVTYTCFLRQP